MNKVHQPTQYTLTLGVKGRLILPVALRSLVSLQEGDKVVITVKPDGRMEMERLFERAKRCEGIFSDVARGESLADTLIAERRAEGEKA